jgi:tetrahydromethanopterin S-methyltransferase subunit B
MATAEKDPLEERLKSLERLLGESARELQELRRHLPRVAREEIDEIADEWKGVHYKWWVGTLAILLVMLTLSYALYTKLGWVADQRALPVGNDWLLRRLPIVDTLPVLSWGWFALHIYAVGAAAAYWPKRVPLLLFTLSTYMIVRTAFVFLSPIGHPVGMVDMRLHDFIFSRILGTWTFTNEFIFSGHTAVPFIFFLFFRSPGLKALMLAGSVTMGVCVLLSRNHYTVDVLAAFLVGYAIYGMSEAAYERWVLPLFQTR